MTLREKVTKRGHIYMALTLLEPHISATGFSLLPTIRASEFKGCGPKGSSSHTHWLNHFYLSAMVTDSGKLSPTFAERLMGFPEGWTDIGQSV